MESEILYCDNFQGRAARRQFHPQRTSQCTCRCDKYRPPPSTSAGRSTCPARSCSSPGAASSSDHLKALKVTFRQQILQPVLPAAMGTASRLLSLLNSARVRLLVLDLLIKTANTILKKTVSDVLRMPALNLTGSLCHINGILGKNRRRLLLMLQ